MEVRGIPLSAGPVRTRGETPTAAQCAQSRRLHPEMRPAPSNRFLTGAATFEWCFLRAWGHWSGRGEEA